MMRYLKYASWILLAILEPIAAILAVLLAPFVVPFYSDKTGHLPLGFRWMETYDNPIDGDKGHVERWANIRNVGWLGVYMQRVAWLWRNKAYNFSYHVLGRDVKEVTKWKGNINISSNSEDNQTGYLLMWNSNAWGLFAFTPSIKVFSKQFYWRIYLGWKLKSIVPEANAFRKKRVMLAFFIHPLRT
ncbi:holin [Citrobacter phage vB_CbrM_HP1]|uniref:Holin n=1 Tax=Citrobacter phage vB_CbrM_HP1 TaxID=2876111 RepID=A0AAE8Z9I0_9CAUD|nr:holin [Citrobacter phage vB_CbrM_HP1]